MEFVRISATNIFGVPIDSTEVLKSSSMALSWIRQYHGVEEYEVEEGPLDITPHYWMPPVMSPRFRYMLSLEPDRALVELLPTTYRSVMYQIMPLSPDVDLDLRTITVPTDQEVVAIIGKGPRYAGQVCVHELIAVVYEDPAGI